MRKSFAVGVFAALLAPAGFAAEVRVLSSTASVHAQQDMAPEFTRATGHTVTYSSGPPNVVQQRLDAGGAFDVIVMPTPRIDMLDKAGRLVPGTSRALARVGIGVAAHESAPRPDLSTLESSRKVLLEARSISYSFSDTGGESGANSLKALANLGVYDAVKAKLVAVPNDRGQAMIGAREVEIGLYNVSEIPRAPGVLRIGPLPAAVQVYSSFDIAVLATGATQAAALAYRDFILDPARRARWEAAGLEQARN